MQRRDALPPQYEDPDGAAAIALFKARTPQANDDGARVSGAQILNFQKGWAVRIDTLGGKAHWFTRSGACGLWVDSLCGVHVITEFMHGPGNYPRCGRCIKTMSRLIKSGGMR